GAGAGSPAAGRMDLLTVVMHELGHVIGLDSRFGGDPADLMAAYLGAGDRRLPGAPAGDLAQPILGAGGDRLIGGRGRNLLIGSGRADRIAGNVGDDLLIAGYTARDGNQAKPGAISDEWTSNWNYTAR